MSGTLASSPHPILCTLPLGRKLADKDREAGASARALPSVKSRNRAAAASQLPRSPGLGDNRDKQGEGVFTVSDSILVNGSQGLQLPGWPTLHLITVALTQNTKRTQYGKTGPSQTA